jgi:hypothetical protein
MGRWPRKTLAMDERLSSVRAELESGNLSPHSLVLLFNAASDAEHAGDLAALEQTQELARAIAESAEDTLRAEAERLVTLCEQSVANVRERRGEASPPPPQTAACPECGAELSADALRCRRCGRRFI